MMSRLRDKRFLIGWVISIVLIIVLLRGFDRDLFFESFRNIGYSSFGYLVIASVFYILAICVRSWGWKTLLDGVLSRTAPFYEIFKAKVVGYTLNNILPFRLGDIAKTVHVAKKYDGSILSAGGALVILRVADMAVMWTFILIGLSVAVHWIFGLAAAIPMVVSYVVYKNGYRIAEWGKVGFVNRLAFCFDITKRSKLALFINFSRLCVWMCEFIAYYIIAIVFGFHDDFGFVGLIPWVMLITGITNAAQITPSGQASIGTFEFFGVIGFVVSGIAKETALGYITFLHFWLSGSACLLGIFYILRGEIPVVGIEKNIENRVSA